MKNKLVVLLFLILVNPGYGQGSKYLVRNYDLIDEINLKGAVWSVVEDSLGILYFGDGNSLITYNGNEWEEFGRGEYQIRTLFCDSKGTIWYGTFDDFGQVCRSENKGYILKSLSCYLPDSLKRTEVIWSINASDNNEIFFQSNNYIYIYRPGTVGLKVHRVNNSYHRACYVAGRYILNEAGRGLVYFDNDKGFLEMRGGSFYNGKLLSGAVCIAKDTILFATRKDGVYIYSLITGTSVPAFNGNKSTNDFLQENNVYHVISLPDGNLAFATLNNGTFICDRKGTKLKLLNIESGLLDCSHYYLGLSHDNNLWICTSSSGISEHDIFSPFACWDYSNGVKGLVTSIRGFKKGILVGTLTGLYYLPDPGNNDYKVQKLFNHNVWDLYPLNITDKEEAILINSSAGLFEFTDHGINQVIADEFILQSVRLCLDTNFIISIGRTHLNISHVSDNGIKKIGRVPEAFGELGAITQDGDRFLWISTLSGKLIRIRQDFLLKYIISNDFNVPLEYDTLNSYTNTSIFNMFGQTIFSNDSGAFVFDTLTNKLTRIKFLGKTVAGFNSRFYTSSIDKQGNIWIGGNRIFVNLRDGTYSLHELPFENIRDIFSAYVFYHDDSGNSWIGGNKGLYIFNNNDINLSEDLKNVLITKIRNSDSIYYVFQNTCNQNENSKLVLKNGQDLSFYFSFPNYKNQSPPRFSYRLDGYSNNWSDWSTEHYTVFNKLKPGHYRFMVKANQPDHSDSSPTCIDFYIEKPWYGTIAAETGFLILVSALIYFIIALIIKQRVKQQLRIENLIQNRLRKQLLLDIQRNINPDHISVSEDQNQRAIKAMDTDINLSFDEDARFIHSLIDTIEIHIDETDLTVEKISSIMNMNQTMLYRKTKSYSGLSVKGLTNKIRMKKASQLLLSTGYSISEIAYKVGFNDPGYFTRYFHKEFGKSPKEFRKK